VWNIIRGDTNGEGTAMRNTCFTFKLSEPERELLRSVAIARGVSASQHVRQAALEAAERWLERAGVEQQREEVERVKD
jgi:uncharacterized protein (DUF1778 family)